MVFGVLLASVAFDVFVFAGYHALAALCCTEWGARDVLYDIHIFYLLVYLRLPHSFIALSR